LRRRSDVRHLADFDAVVARAHDLGLRVMIDLVLSHTSDQHPWFKESRVSRTNPRADWYVWADPKPDGTPPNNWLSVFGGSRPGPGTGGASSITCTTS
jgi:alpha-glucosidase